MGIDGKEEEEEMTPTMDEIRNAREHLRMLFRVSDKGVPYGTENAKQLSVSIDALSDIINGTLIEAATEDVEAICEKVHKAYCKYYQERKGTEYWTKGDYSKLTEEGKEYDRVTVRAVLDALAGR